MPEDIEKMLDSWGRRELHRMDSGPPTTRWMQAVERAHFIHKVGLLALVLLAIGLLTLTVVLISTRGQHETPTAPAPENTARLIAPEQSKPTRLLDGVPRLRDLGRSQG